jgi:hypothetical protein
MFNKYTKCFSNHCDRYVEIPLLEPIHSPKAIAFQTQIFISSYKNYDNNLENIVYLCSENCKYKFEMNERCNSCHIWIIPIVNKKYNDFTQPSAGLLAQGEPLGSLFPKGENPARGLNDYSYCNDKYKHNCYSAFIKPSKCNLYVKFNIDEKIIEKNN